MAVAPFTLTTRRSGTELSLRSASIKWSEWVTIQMSARREALAISRANGASSDECRLAYGSFSTMNGGSR